MRAMPRPSAGGVVVGFLLLGCTASPGAVAQGPRTHPSSNDQVVSRNLTATAAPARSLKIARDFQVELLYSVPKSKQGSWISLCVDPRGRLIASDQNGPLYRITPPLPGGSVLQTKVEKLDLSLGGGTACSMPSIAST